MPVIIGDALKTFGVCHELLEEGLYANPVLHPAVPKGREMLRVSCVATHTAEHIERAVEIFARVGRRYGLVQGATA